MPQVITENEMDRRRAMAAALVDVTNALSNHSLTAMEWVNVLHEVTTRMIQHGLTDDWSEDA